MMLPNPRQIRCLLGSSPTHTCGAPVVLLLTPEW